MKNILYGTTALIAVSMVAGSAGAAEKIKLGLGGYWRAAIHMGDTNNDSAAAGTASDFRNHGFGRESEIYFSGKTTLDNGIKFGVMVQLEGETSGDQMDNSYIWSAGSFGRLEYGETWGPGLLMYAGGVGEKLSSHGDFASHNPSNGPNGLGINSFGGGAGLRSRPITKLNYFTPRMSGLQLGVGYVPDAQNNSAGSGLQSKLTGDTGNEMVDVAANYVGKFGGAGVRAHVGWFGSETETAAIGAAAGRDAEGYSMGAQVGFSGFRVGGRYTVIDDIQGTAVATPSLEQVNYRFGVDYSTGPWGVGVVVQKATREQLNGVVKSTRDDVTDYMSVAGSYSVGPGISVYGGVQFWDFQDSANLAAASPQTEADSTVGVIGTLFKF